MQHLRLQLATDKPDTVLSVPAILYAQSWKTTSRRRANGKATLAAYHQRKVRSLKPQEKMVPKHWDADAAEVKLKWYCQMVFIPHSPSLVIWPTKP